MLRLVRNLTLALILLSSTIVVSSVTAVGSSKPTVAGFKVLPASLNYNGGSVTASATVNNATRCIFTSTPAVAGVYKNLACNSGRVSYTAKFPANSSSKNIVYTFKLIVTGKKGDGNVTAPLKTVTVVAGPKPIISSFTTSNSELSSGGGIISLTGVVANESTCSISANPAIEGTSSNPVTCSGGSAIASVAMPPNSSALNINYIFTLTVAGVSGSTVSKTVEITVDSNPPATTTTTTTTTTTPPSTTTGNTVGVPAEPDALMQVGNDIWVASCSGNALTEINVSTKRIVEELNSSAYEFNCPDALAFDGANIWVANKLGNSLTEINASTVSLVNIITGSDILNPDALAFDGANIWVANNSINGTVSFISEFKSSSGVEIRSKYPPRNYQWSLTNPTSIIYTGGYIWVSDSSNSEANEFNASTGVFVRTQQRAPVSVGGVSGLAYSGGHLWISGYDTNDVVEYVSTTGAYVRYIKVNTPNQLIFDGSDLFVITNAAPVDTVVEYNSTGTLLRTIARSNEDLGKGFSAILLDGSNLWTANYSSDSVTVHPNI